MSGKTRWYLHDRRINTIMKLDNLKIINETEAFLVGSQAIAFAVASSKDEPEWVFKLSMTKTIFSASG